jgi:hypothetical protein
MAKKARKKTKAKKTKKTTKKSSRAKTRRAKARRTKTSRTKTRKRPRKLGSAFQIMIDTINQTERLREKRELRGSDESA